MMPISRRSLRIASPLLLSRSHLTKLAAADKIVKLGVGR